MSKREVEVLAKEVLSQIKQTKSPRQLSDEKIKQIRDFKSQWQILSEAEKEASRELRRHESAFSKIVGNVKGVYTSDSVEKIVRDLTADNFPTLNSIEEKILLKKMFSSAEDMEEFTSQLVKQFTRQKSRKPTILNQ